MSSGTAAFLFKPTHFPSFELLEFSCLLRSLAFILLSASVITACWKWKKTVKRLKRIPAPKANPVLLFFGIFRSAMRTKISDRNVLFFQILCGIIHLAQHHRIFRIWMGLRPVVLCYTPEVFEAILKSSTNLRKSFSYNFLSPWLKEGLVTSQGWKWKQRRKMLTPAFHFRILEDFLPIFEEQGRILVRKFIDIKDKGDIDIVPYVTLCTLDIICESAMGFHVGAQEHQDSVYLSSMHRVCKIFTARIMRPWLWPDLIFYFTAMGKEFRKNVNKMDAFTRQVIRERKDQIKEEKHSLKETDNNNGVYQKRKAFLDLLLEHSLIDATLSDYDIQEEVDSFMFAGHDTTAAGISWALYLLGLHPDVQKKVLEEVDSVFHGDKERLISLEDIRELKYMDCVIKECQRLYPSAPFISRDLTEDIVFDDFIIPSGTTCLLVMYMLHRNRQSFQDPEKFDPDRFLPENSVGRHPYAFCPFSAGPRSCIGQKYALMELKAVIATVFRHLTVTSVEYQDQLQLTSEMVTRTKNGLKMSFKTRQ